ncbi:MAG: integrase core domain-containing protein [Candidatus Saccharimonadales bacterium]
MPEYIHYYNTNRPHQGLDWLTPVQKLHKVIPRS